MRTAQGTPALRVTLLLLLFAGCLCLLIGIPALVLWLLAEAGASRVWHFALGVTAIPFAMAAFAPVLFWLNTLYMQRWGATSGGTRVGRRRPLQGPLEPMLVVCVIVSIAAGFYWFFFLAHNPPRQFI